MNTKNPIVDSIIAAMQSQIEKHGLELMQRYPSDLLVHDRAMLERGAVPGAQIAWMCGHSHTHLVMLGLHKEENEKTTYLTHLSNDDRFYIIKVQQDGKFSMKEVERQAFADLCRTEVRYEQSGQMPAFWLTTRSKRRVGFISCEMTGPYEKRKVIVTITPIALNSELDKSALEMWASHATVKMAGTLFIASAFVWAEPIAEMKAA